MQGGFLAGLIIPHDNGYAITLVEKVEDLVSVLLLPLVGYIPFTDEHTNLIRHIGSISPYLACEPTWAY